MKPLRFGLHAFAPSGHDEWVELARRAEGGGFTSLTMPDHLIEGCASPFSALGVAAQATTSLRIGTLVINNELRHPALVAREALALDALSGGRFELGLGAGSAMSAAELESIGMPYPDGPTRVARLGESVEIIDGLLRGDAVTFTGEHYHLSDHRAWPAPTQRPRLPILVGGAGPRVLRLAAARADVVTLSGVGGAGLAPAAVDQQVAVVRATAIGRDIEVQTLVQDVIVTDDRHGAAEQVRQRAPDLAIDDILATPSLWIGSVESICEQVEAARERWGNFYFSVFQPSLEAATPIVEQLAGT